MKLKTLATMALVGALLIGGSAANAVDNQADWTTTLNVKLALLNKLGTDSLHVDVDSSAGALTLKGTVDKRETRELAEAVAKSVSGVKSVQNDLLLEASEANPNKAGVAAGEADPGAPRAGQEDGLGWAQDRHGVSQRRGDSPVRQRFHRRSTRGGGQGRQGRLWRDQGPRRPQGVSFPDGGVQGIGPLGKARADHLVSEALSGLPIGFGGRRRGGFYPRRDPPPG